MAAAAESRVEDTAQLAGQLDDASSSEEESLVSSKWWANPTLHIVLAVIVGLTIGMVFDLSDTLVQILSFPGKLWLKALKCIVLPMIIFSMVLAMVMMRSLPGAKKIGAAVVGLYLATTALAALGGCIFAPAILLGTVHPVDQNTVTESEVSAVKDLTRVSTLDNLLNIIDQLVPANLVMDAANNRLLPVIVASVICGMLIRAKDENGMPTATISVISDLNDVVTKIITVIIKLTPFGVGSLVFSSAAKFDIGKVAGSVGMLMICVMCALAFHVCVVYPVLLLVLARRNPLKYYLNLIPALLTAMGTSSSAAALPVSITCSIEKNGLAPPLAKFVLSLGATINMDGTGIYLICAAFFLGRLEDVPFTLDKFLVLAIMATLCSMGAAPVPSASLVLLTTILTAVGVPITESFGLITAVDWMLDRFRTAVNVAGDNTVAGIVHTLFAEQHASLSKVDEEDLAE